MTDSGRRELFDLLDALVALRLHYANGTPGEKALEGLGRATVLEVRTILDGAIDSTKRVIGEAQRSGLAKRGAPKR